MASYGFLDSSPGNQENADPIDGNIIRPFVADDRKIIGCACQRCPRLVGQEQRCCGRNAGDCLSLRRSLSRILAAEAPIDRTDEARQYGGDVNATHRFHCYDSCWKAYHTLFDEQWPHMKLPNCVEHRIHDVFPSIRYTGFKRQKRPAPGGGGRGPRRRIPRLC